MALTAHGAVAGVSPTEPARVIVKLKASVLASSQTASGVTLRTAQGWQAMHESGHQRIQGLTRRVGVNLGESRELGPDMHLARASGISSKELARRLSAQSDVAFAVVDERRYVNTATPDDPHFGPQPAPNGANLRQPAAGQWYLRAPDVTTPAAIDAPSAWAITSGSRAVVVAVLDTGIRYDHADLQGKLLPGYNMISVAAIAGNDVGRTNNPSDLGDFITQADKDNNPSLFANCSLQSHARSTWHGTQVAGLIGAATNNALGMAGLGQDIQILPVRVLGKCGGYDSDIIDGMRWAAGLQVGNLPLNPYPAKVLNLSLGSQGPCSTPYVDVMTELSAMNVFVVAAAGNTVGQAVETPGRCANVLAVTALRQVGSKVQYASVGPEVFIAAPGGNCLNPSGPCLYPLATTFNTGTTVPLANGSTYTDAYLASVGTSFAAPLVSGTVALMLSVNPSLTLAEVKSHLTNSARAFPLRTDFSPNLVDCVAPQNGVDQDQCACTTNTCGVGMLNAGAAVAAARDAATTPVAVVSLSSDAPVVGSPLTLSSIHSRPGPGAGSITSRQWTLLSGGGIVSSAGGAGSTLTVTPTGKGVFRVRLSVTDSLNQVHQVDLNIPVDQTVSITEGPFLAKSSGGGGGGAADGALLALLSLAAVHTALAWLAWLSPGRRRALRAM